MDNFIFKLFSYALIGLIVFMAILRFSWFACIGIIVVGFFYFGFKKIKNGFRRNKD